MANPLQAVLDWLIPDRRSNRMIEEMGVEDKERQMSEELDRLSRTCKVDTNSQEFRNLIEESKKEKVNGV